MAIYRNQTGTVEPATTSFYKDVVQGLSASPKYLSSKYFYDVIGDRLFQQIMQLPEYYLTRSEQEIFLMQTKALAKPLLHRFQQFDVIELGAGDATKSTHLLQELANAGKSFTYFPVDISANVIQLLEKEIPERVPGLQVEGLNGDYFEMLEKCYQVSKRRKLVLFLGSNIGNYTLEQAEEFLLELNDHLLPGDLVLIGFDLKKNPKDILAAYNDRTGITKAFNLNLLRRINEELDADFDLLQFDHFPTYDPITGACKSYLISLADQEVRLGDQTFSFARYEPIWTELSQKYSVQEINEMAIHTGFQPVQNFFDCRHWFVDALWEKS